MIKPRTYLSIQREFLSVWLGTILVIGVLFWYNEVPEMFTAGTIFFVSFLLFLLRVHELLGYILNECREFNSTVRSVIGGSEQDFISDADVRDLRRALNLPLKE